MAGFVRFVIRQRAAVLLMAGILLVSGTLVAFQMQLELFPNVSFNTIDVVTPYPGASPDAVLNDVTKPVEAAVASTPGIDTLTSTSMEGTSVVVARFKYGTNIEAVQSHIATNVSTLQLPTGTQKPTVATIDFSAFPIQYFAVTSTRSTMTLQDTYRLVQREIQPALQQVPGVAAADVSGGVNPEVLITLHPRDLAAHHLTPDAVAAALQANGITMPVGSVTASGHTQPVVVTGRLSTLAAIRNLPILPSAGFFTSGTRPTPQPGAMTVRLADVATVTLTHSAYNVLGTNPGEIAGIVRYNGRPAISISIRKSTDANIVRVADGVTSKLRDIGRRYPQLKIATIYDSSSTIKESVSSLLRDGIFGAIFAILVIFLFLLTVRSTLVTALSIPLSILTAIIVLDLFGYSLNIMTISGIAIAVGRVVDDAIVVLENIYRHVQEGDARVDAVVNGVREVSRAIIGSTATTIAVFLPIGFIGGILGQFFQPFALTVTFALVASLVMALVVVPALGSVLIRRKVRPERETYLQRIYTPVLSWALSHRAVTVVSAGILFVLSLGLLTVIPKGFFPQSTETIAQMSVQLPPGTSLGRTTSVTAAIERSIISRQPGIQKWETIVGYDNEAAQRGSGGGAANAATLLLIYRGGTDMVSSLDRLRRDVLPLQHNGTFVSVQGVQQGPPSTVDLLVTGNNGAQIRQATAQVFTALHGVSGLVNLQSNLQARKPQIAIRVDPNRALAHGLTPAAAAAAIRQDLTGQTVTTVQLTGQSQSATVFVQVDPSQTNTLQNLSALQIGTPPVPLREIARVTQTAGPVAINRQNQQNVGEITAAVNNSTDSSTVTSKVSRAIAPLQTRWSSRNITIGQGGIGDQINQGFINMGIAMLVAIGMVYLVMVFIFRSLLVPFVILFALPLALIGALVALAITRRQLDMSALIGMLMLIGVVVTNAVVLLDLVQQKLEAGLPLFNALMEGGRTRVRPILMTAAATILALTPLAVIGSGGGLIAGNLATVVIGGLLTSTGLTLIVVPVIYSLFSSLRGKLSGRESRAQRSTTGVAPQTAAVGTE